VVIIKMHKKFEQIKEFVEIHEYEIKLAIKVVLFIIGGILFYVIGTWLSHYLTGDVWGLMFFGVYLFSTVVSMVLMLIVQIDDDWFPLILFPTINIFCIALCILYIIGSGFRMIIPYITHIHKKRKTKKGGILCG